MFGSNSCVRLVRSFVRSHVFVHVFFVVLVGLVRPYVGTKFIGFIPSVPCCHFCSLVRLLFTWFVSVGCFARWLDDMAWHSVVRRTHTFSPLQRQCQARCQLCKDTSSIWTRTSGLVWACPVFFFRIRYVWHAFKKQTVLSGSLRPQSWRLSL